MFIGIRFWKVGSRKIFAIKDDEALPEAKKVKISSADDSTNNAIEEKIDCIDFKLTKILDIAPNLPIGLSSLIYETFKCSICHTSPIIPPAIFARCCRSIVGCQRCVDKWYRGEAGSEKKCPLCRGDRGYADTSQIVGLDNFLTEINSIFCHVPPPPTEVPLDL